MADKAHTDDREFPQPCKAARRGGIGDEAEAVLARWGACGTRLEPSEQPLEAPSSKGTAPSARKLA